MPTISISTREDENNRSMIQPPARTESGLTLRPISLGSLEVLRQLGNPLSAGNAELTKSQNTIRLSCSPNGATNCRQCRELFHTQSGQVAPYTLERAVAEAAQPYIAGSQL